MLTWRRRPIRLGLTRLNLGGDPFKHFVLHVSASEFDLRVFQSSRPLKASRSDSQKRPSLQGDRFGKAGNLGRELKRESRAF